MGTFRREEPTCPHERGTSRAVGDRRVFRPALDRSATGLTALTHGPASKSRRPPAVAEPSLAHREEPSGHAAVQSP
ncbi:MAG TPA: hypothetical protein DCQ98_07420 [Planctomycetaceae bacterium]|nr:hypothetical protein [Planctomycetaceae bacterium]